jgi:hypothetical protein
MRRLCVLTVLAMAVPFSASAQSYEHGRIRHVEEGVSIQRATETGAEEALANLPFLPGDRVWTDGGGRAEFQFAGGSLLRLDTASKLDYVSHDNGREERIVLRLWSGALFLHTRDGRDGDFEVETPGGVVIAGGRAAVRIDVQSGETRLSVHDGQARLEGAEAVTVRAGERVYARRGQIEEGPVSFDRAEGDEFAAWNDARQEQATYAANRPVPLPEDVAPYGDELDRHGSWYHETEVGYVWRPYVAAGWQPYSQGRWIWTVYGWTWVPYESWGWAVSHYGRWGHAPALGWYWIPGARWAPAWVSWAAGGDYVGWCPLGYRDRPVLVYDRFRRGTRGGLGHAVPRDGATVARNPWVYLRRGDLAAHDLGRRRVQLDGASVAQVRMLDQVQARLTRDVSVGTVPAGAVARPVPRNVASRPTIGDTVPELRPDPMTTIPVVRRRGRAIESGDEGGGVRSGGAAGPVPTGAAVRFDGGGTSEPVTAAPRGGSLRGTHPTDARAGQRRPAGEGPETVAQPRRRYEGVEARTPERPVRERGGASEAEREVLRPMFRPLGRQRDAGSEGRAGQGGSMGRRGDGEGRRAGDGEARRGGDGAVRRGGDGAVRRGNDGEGRRGGVQGHSREASPRQASPRDSGSRPEAQAQPRQRQPPPSAAGRRPRRGNDQ